MAMNAPVVFIIFNRPTMTERVFAEIARARPSRLFIIADGPRSDHPEDTDKCAATRAIVERVDWECEVRRNYSEVNLGCGYRPATGISWVFENVEEAIILEDDCLPDPTFFKYCAELLEKYRDDERVMMISGRNHNCGAIHTPNSYFFSNTGSNWGWATWRRAWRHYDFEIDLWPELRESSWLEDVLRYPSVVQYWQNIFEKTYSKSKKIDYWDYQWIFACWTQNGLAAVPKNNLIQNIGFGENSTHTKKANHVMSHVAKNKMVFPLKHPSNFYPYKNEEWIFFKKVIEPSLKKKGLLGKMKKNISEIDRKYLNGYLKTIFR